MTRLISLAAATLVVVSSFAIYGGTAAAHERRMVGPYQFVVGWLNEPDTTLMFRGTPEDYARMLSAAYGEIKARSPGSSVLLGGVSGTTAKDWLTRVFATSGVRAATKFDIANVHVRGGLGSLPLTVTARFGTPGAYNGYVMPTTTGTYTFTIKGKIDTLDVNEKFESGPGRFGDIESTTALQYPNKVPAADELTKRLGDMQSSIDQTRLLSAAAVIIGVVALGVAFAMSRRRA